MVTCPRPPVFARPKKYSSCLSLHSQRLLSWVTATYFTPPRGEGGEQRRGLMPLGLFLFSIFLVVTCPRPPVFARPNILVASFATQARACVLSDHSIFCTPRGGGNGGVMPLGLFLFFFCRRGHLPQTSARPKQYLPVILVRLALFRQNFHESWCRKLLAI